VRAASITSPRAIGVISALACSAYSGVLLSMKGMRPGGGADTLAVDDQRQRGDAPERRVAALSHRGTSSSARDAEPTVASDENR
jgi:hypothetical protein